MKPIFILFLLLSFNCLIGQDNGTQKQAIKEIATETTILNGEECRKYIMDNGIIMWLTTKEKHKVGDSLTVVIDPEKYQKYLNAYYNSLKDSSNKK